MAKLYFRYGTMDSAKSMNLLAVAHNYRKQGKRVLLVKPRLDSRFGSDKIASRSGLEAPADLLVDEDTVLDPRDFDGLDCVLVDEAQFLPPSVIEDLRRITVDPGVPVICYGLRTDFRTKLFPGAQRLMELAGRIRGLDPLSRESRQMQRHFFAGAVAVAPDKQGRIVLPTSLLEEAGIAREVTVAGMYDHLEIWDRAKWRAHLHKVEGSAEDVAERLAN